MIEKLSPFDAALGFYDDDDPDWREYATLRSSSTRPRRSPRSPKRRRKRPQRHARSRQRLVCEEAGREIVREVSRNIVREVSRKIRREVVREEAGREQADREVSREETAREETRAGVQIEVGSQARLTSSLCRKLWPRARRVSVGNRPACRGAMSL